MGGVVAAMSVIPIFLVGSFALQISADIGGAPGVFAIMVAGAFGVSAAGAVTAGKVNSRIGPVTTIRISMGWCTVCCLAAAFAPSPAFMAGAVLLSGIANPLAQIAVNSYLARSVGPQHLGIAMAVKQSSIPVAALISGAAIPLVAVTLGWRWGFVGAAFIGLLAMSARYPIERPAPGRGWKESLTRQDRVTLIPLALAAFFAACASFGLTSHFVLAAVDVGLTAPAAGALFSVGAAFALLLRLYLGAVADRGTLRTLPTAAGLLLVGACGYVALAMGGAVWLVVAVPLVFIGWSWQGLLVLAVVRTAAQAPGKASALTQTGGALGSCLGPALVGLISQTSGFAAAWWTTSLMSVAAAAALLYAMLMQKKPTATARG
jgi:MFS family permease